MRGDDPADAVIHGAQDDVNALNVVLECLGEHRGDERGDAGNRVELGQGAHGVFRGREPAVDPVLLRHRHKLEQALHFRRVVRLEPVLQIAQVAVFRIEGDDLAFPERTFRREGCCDFLFGQIEGRAAEPDIERQTAVLQVEGVLDQAVEEAAVVIQVPSIR